MSAERLPRLSNRAHDVLPEFVASSVVRTAPTKSYARVRHVGLREKSRLNENQTQKRPLSLKTFEDEINPC